MKSSDFKCTNCGKIDTIYVNDYADFPEKIQCYGCLAESKRIFTPIPGIVYQGKAGNAKNNYKSSPVYIKKTGSD